MNPHPQGKNVGGRGIRTVKMQGVRDIARQWGVDVRVGRSKQDIIRDIQIKENYSPCFGTKDECEYYDCLWRSDCLNNRR